jgi:hypothetical protein
VAKSPQGHVLGEVPHAHTAEERTRSDAATADSGRAAPLPLAMRRGLGPPDSETSDHERTDGASSSSKGPSVQPRPYNSDFLR